MIKQRNFRKILIYVILISLVVIILLDILRSGDNSSLLKFIRHKESINIEADLNDIDILPEYQNREPSTEDLFAEIEKDLPNIPFGYSLNYNKQPRPKNYKCAQFPSLKLLNYYNNYWQTFHLENITIQLYGAYYDERKALDKGRAKVRILAMINQITAPFPESYCQLWFENDRKPVITKITQYKLMWHVKWGKSPGVYYPYLMTCDMPAGQRIPKAVTIVGKECALAKNALKVIYDKPKEKLPFAVCVKGLDFPYADISARVAEWLEMMSLLGASRVYFHQIATHPNVAKILTHYEQQNFVELHAIGSINNIVGMPHLQHWLVKPSLLIKRLDEIIPYNDCFYRNIYKYDYIALIDIDEVIMPLGNHTTWLDLVEQVQMYEKFQKCSNGFAALCFQNIYFPYSNDNFSLIQSPNENIAKPSIAPSFMFMANRQYRIPNHDRVGYNAKCLHNTEQALTLHNHYPISWLNGCRSYNLPNTTAQLQHYHDIHSNKKYHELVLDDSIERFKSVLIEKTTRVLNALKLL